MSRAYEAIAAQLLAMTDDAGNWKPCWHRSTLQLPINRQSRRAYRGANILSLWVSAELAGYPTGEWASFKQWLDLGQCVRKGEKGTPIVFFGQHEKEKDDGGKDRYRFVRGATVFNIAQVDPLEGHERLPVDKWDGNPDGKIAAADAFALGTGAKIVHLEDNYQPHYQPGFDRVVMPTFETFHSADGYYAVLLHELTHWTGAKHRLDRMTLHDYGTDISIRAMEELVAELGAAFLCASLGLQNEPRPDHATYLRNWHEVLKRDTSAFMHAVGMASAAAEYLHGLQKAEAA